MNINFKLEYLLIYALCACTKCLGHEIPVHQRITESAADSALSFSPAYAEFLNIVSPEISISDARRYLSQGSAKEDDVTEQDPIGGNRSYNHFYDPLTRQGLSNIPPDDRIPPLGKDSFSWGSQRNCPGVNFPGVAGLGRNVGKYNTWSWQNARDYEWLGLTAASKSDRFQALTNMFRAVGQVVHLLQDTSQPQHVRNEHHVYYGKIHIWHSPIEIHGAENLPTLNFQQGMLNWRSAGFKRLEDFWDRRLYNGNASALNADANGSSKLGLAEFANGNFVGDRHLFPEYFTPGKVAYYPFPSRTTSSNYEQVKANPVLGIETYTLNERQVKGIFIWKTADGITGYRLSRMNYLGAKQFSGLTAPAFCTIRDDKVLAGYHDILIPKAIEYSAGAIDYFFRGRLEVTPTANAGGGYDLEIKNVSGQDLKGGEFGLYWDDTSDNRTRLLNPGSESAGNFLLSWSESSSLANNGIVTATFKRPADVGVKKYTLVYKGTIGTASGQPLDPVDHTICIAAQTLCPSDSGSEDAPDYYHYPIPPQPARVYFKEVAALEALLAGSIYDDADPEDPLLSDGIPLYDVGSPFGLKPVRYAGSSPGTFNVGGKRVTLWAYMYYEDPYGFNNDNWRFTADCYLNENWVALLAGYKSVGTEVVGAFADYSNLPGWYPALYTGPMTLTPCKDP